MTTTFSFQTKLTLVLAAALGTGACSAAPRALPAVPASAQTCAGARVSTAAELQALAPCRAIQGDLRIERSTLSSLEELARLETITGSLHIASNPQLDDLGGLSRLRSVRTLVVRDNPALESLEGLDGLRSLDKLTLSNNGIYNTRGLGGLDSVGDLVVADNDRLISLSGLAGLRVATSVRIVNNPRLARALGFLDAMLPVPGPVLVEGNSGLGAHERDDVVARLTRQAPRIAVR